MASPKGIVSDAAKILREGINLHPVTLAERFVRDGYQGIWQYHAFYPMTVLEHSFGQICYVLGAFHGLQPIHAKANLLVQVCQVVRHAQRLDMAVSKGIAFQHGKCGWQFQIVYKRPVEGILTYCFQSLWQFQLVQEVGRRIGIYAELAVGNLLDDSLAEVKVLQVVHHLYLCPVVAVHLALYLQSTDVLDMVGVVQNFRSKATRLKQVDTYQRACHYSSILNPEINMIVGISCQFPLDSVSAGSQVFDKPCIYVVVRPTIALYTA